MKNKLLNHRKANPLNPPYQGDNSSSPPAKGGKGGFLVEVVKNKPPKSPLSGGLSGSYPPDKGGEGGFLSYNQALTAKARENRKNPTPAEKKLWYEVLQDERLSGFKFIRQKPLDKFIVDFYCSKLMLAIEIDGDSHAKQSGYDEHRTHKLNALGISVVRYTNADILNNLEGVYADLVTQVAGKATP